MCDLVKIIQVTNTYKGDVLEIVKSCVPEGFVLRTLTENTEAALCACVADADYILASGRVKINGMVLDKAQKLKMIQRTGVGVDSLDIPEIRRRGIGLYVNQGVNARSVAEHAVLLILACLRRLPEISANTKSGLWIKQAQGIRTRELGKCRVGVIGAGNIGKTVITLLNTFGAEICYYDAFRMSEEIEAEMGVQYLPYEELMQWADVLTLHCPMTEQTAGIIRKETLDTMKDGVIIVNTARGGLIREEDLLEALQTGKVGFAGLDVFESEPPKNMALLEHPRVIATSHVAGVTYDSFRQMMQDAMDNIRCFEEGKLQEIEKNRL